MKFFQSLLSLVLIIFCTAAFVESGISEGVAVPGPKRPTLPDIHLHSLIAQSPFTCFVYRFVYKKEHRWEKDIVVSTFPWVLIDQDNTAVFLAQPSEPACEEAKPYVKQCDAYWLRTVTFKEDFTPADPEIVSCPKGLISKIKRLINEEMGK